MWKKQNSLENQGYFEVGQTVQKECNMV